MYNVRIIEYPKSYQIRLYKDAVLDEDERYYAKIDAVTGEKIERGKKEIPRDTWLPVGWEFEQVGDVYQNQVNESLRVSATRSKNMLYYLARSNVWDWFVTLTLDEKKIDRYDFDEVSKKVRKWFNHIKERKSPEMYYLIVPEQHKDGAWHFHGLIGGCSGLQFVDSGKKDSKGNPIYNFEDWKYGFSTATAVGDTEKVSSYISKYITKTLCESTPGKQRYWVSNNCQRAPIEEYHLDGVDMKEYREKLYEMMSWKKKDENAFCTVEYFEVPKGDKESE